MKILITQLGRIGDMILLTPMFSLIKEKYPNCCIDVICGTKNHPVIRFNPHINHIHIFDKSPLKLVRLFVNIRKNKYDFYIDPKDHFSRESSMLAKIIQAKNKIGLIYDEKSSFNLPIPNNEENKGKHYTLKILNPLAYLDIDISQTYYKPVIYESPDSIAYFKEFQTENSFGKYIVINISASQKRKMWDKDKWVELINLMNQNSKLKSFNFVISSAPSELTELNYIIQNTRKILHYKSRNLLDVVSLIKNSDLLITPDTALVHIAAAYNIKLIGLFANNPLFYSMFHPLSDCYEAVMTPEGSEIINDISVNQVFDSLIRISEKL